MLLNMFFGPAVNAARGIAVQVQGIIQGFVANVQTAVNPQITKSYAQQNLRRMHKLMFTSSKFCFYLLFLLVFPFSLEANQILHVWLGVVPDHTVWFFRLIAFIMLTETLANPYIVANQATGKVKIYQAICGGLLLLIVPVSYIVLRFGGNPESVYIVHGCIAVMTQFARVYMMRNLIDLSLATYARKVVLPILYVAITAAVIPTVAYNEMPINVVSFFVVCSLCVICTLSALVVLTSGLWERGEYTGAALTIVSFDSVIPYAGGICVTFSTIFFALSTILGWAYYGEVCVEYLFGKSKAGVLCFRCVYIIVVFLGAIGNLDLIWSISEAMNGLMAIPNLIGIIGLNKVVIKTTNEYFSRKKIIK